MRHEHMSHKQNNRQASISESDQKIENDLTKSYLAEFDQGFNDIDKINKIWQTQRQDGQHLNQMLSLLHTLKGCLHLMQFFEMADHVHQFESWLDYQLQDNNNLTDYFFNSLDAKWNRVKQIWGSLKLTLVIGPKHSSISLKNITDKQEPEVQLINKICLHLGLAQESGLLSAECQQEMAAIGSCLEEIVADINLFNNACEGTTKNSVLQKYFLNWSESLLRLGKSQPNNAFQNTNKLLQALGARIRKMEMLLTQQVGVTEDMLVNINHDYSGANETHYEKTILKLNRIVRQLARELGKDVILEIQTQHVNLSEMMDSDCLSVFEQVLKNAIVHGIESENIRKKVRKSVHGRILWRLFREKNYLCIEISDDGAGMNINKIRDRAVQMGLLSTSDTGENITDKDILQLSLQPGVSTKSHPTCYAGRGLGLSTLQSKLECLGGDVEIHSDVGRGTKFCIRLPICDTEHELGDSENK